MHKLFGKCYVAIFLFPSQPYDPKKSCWVPLKEGGFAEGTIESAEGDKVSVKIAKDDRRVIKKDQVQQVNPPKFERCEDMSNLTYLNDASVLHNLKARYTSKLIYVRIGSEKFTCDTQFPTLRKWHARNA